jgi:hypothetical protein
MVSAREKIRDELLPQAQEAGALFIVLASRIMAREDLAKWFRGMADAIESGEHDDKPSMRRLN